ncbi:unnamed protein product [Polarella glacialis]|uniref:GST N-terminal domain-containing protein n=1 Tax=Polarella glacialis TaxID=89957 RepID=A0A813D863_POLGL|nr:unnamed protein product [Polarella glacialis]
MPALLALALTASLVTIALKGVDQKMSAGAVRRSGSQERAAGQRQQQQPAAKLVTNKMCPYAQKAWIAMEESGLPYTMSEISLYGMGGKPSWFLQLNPLGQIPVLVAPSGKVLVDSERILDWVAEQVPSMAPGNAKLAAAWRSCLLSRVAPWCTQ